MHLTLLTLVGSSLSLILSLVLIILLILREFTTGGLHSYSRWSRRILNVAILPLAVVLLVTVGTKLASGQLASATAHTRSASTTQPMPPPLPSQVAMITLDTIRVPTAVVAPTLAPTISAATSVPLASPTTPLSSPASGLPVPVSIVVVKDDFNSSASGWLTRKTKTWDAGYQNGGYQLTLHGQPNIGISSALPTDNYRISVDVEATTSRAGLVFLSSRPATFYRFMLQGDTYAVQMLQQDTNTVSNVVDWTHSAAVHTTPGTKNRLRVETRGHVVRLFVNEQALTTWETPLGQFVNQFGFALTAPNNQASATFHNVVVERIIE